jgi:hypothetical protein
VVKNTLSGIFAVSAALLFSHSVTSTPINLQKQITAAVSFNDQTSSSDATSLHGADLSVLFKFVGGDTSTTGIFSAQVLNSSSIASGAIMTAIAVGLNSDILTSADSLLFSEVSCSACGFSIAIPTSLN